MAKAPVGSALTCCWDQEIERFGPNKDLNRASNRNLSTQIHVWNSFQSCFLLLPSPKPKLGRAGLRWGPAQSSAVQHPERVPDITALHGTETLTFPVLIFSSFPTHQFKPSPKKKKKRSASRTKTRPLAL